MKLLSTAAIATTLFSFVAADISPAELQQRALKAISIKNSNAFRRELVTQECINNQEVVEATGINEGIQIEEDQVLELCDVDIAVSEVTVECDYDTNGLSMDSGACSSAGGRVVKIDYESECDATEDNPLKSITHIHNMPVCLHTTCDAGEYAQVVEDIENIDASCEIDISVVSGAAIGSTSIISIALVSLFVMIW